MSDINRRTMVTGAAGLAALAAVATQATAAPYTGPSAEFLELQKLFTEQREVTLVRTEIIDSQDFRLGPLPVKPCWPRVALSMSVSRTSARSTATLWASAGVGFVSPITSTTSRRQRLDPPGSDAKSASFAARGVSTKRGDELGRHRRSGPSSGQLS